MAEPRTIRSPKENIAEKELIIVQDGQTRLKTLVAQSSLNGLSREEILKRVAKIINETTSKLPEAIRKTVKTSLISSWQRWDKFYTKARQTANTALLAQASRFFQRNPEIIKADKTISIDLRQFLSDKTGTQDGGQLINRFRPYLTEDKRGMAIIEDYDKKVKLQLKVLATDPASTIDKNGKKLPLRNLAEMQVRYEANQEDIKKLGNDGADLVWTSSHADASPRCEPWQGRLYSISGKSGTIDGIPYTPLSEATDANGGNSIISGYNCRHRLIEYSKGSKSPKEYDSKTIKRENAVNARQRTYESDIRNIKIEERISRASGNTVLAKELRQEWKEKLVEYEAFSQRNQRPYYLWRTRITQEEIEYQD